MDNRKFPEIFSNREIAAVVVLTIGNSLIRMLQPLLLGALVHENRLTVTELGWAATIELLAVGITIGVAGTWLKPERLHVIAILTIAVSVVVNIGTAFASPVVFMLLRAGAGISSGLVLWILYAMVARLNVPARVMGRYIGSQAGVAMAFASICSWYVIPTFGAAGGFVVLSLLGAGLIFCIPFMPRKFGPLAVQQAERTWPGARGFFALFTIFACATGIMALWVYVDPLARYGGLGDEEIGYAITAGLGMQIVGGWTASYVGHRLNAVTAFALGCCANIPILVLLWIGAAAPLFIAAVAMFGFLWAFVLSFATPFALMNDPTGRAALLLGTAELFGAASGPAVVSMLVYAFGVGVAPIVSAALFAIATVASVVLRQRPQKVAFASS